MKRRSSAGKRSVWTVAALVMAAVMSWSGPAPASSGARVLSPALSGSVLRRHLELRRSAEFARARRAAVGSASLLQPADTTHANPLSHPVETKAKNVPITGTLSKGTLSRTRVDKTDLYRIYLAAGDILNFTLDTTSDAASADFDPDVYLYRAADWPYGKPLNQSNRYVTGGGQYIRTAEQFIQQIPATGYYYVYLEGYVGSGTYCAMPAVTTDDTAADVMAFSRGFTHGVLGLGADTKDSYTFPIPDGDRRVIYAGPSFGSALTSDIALHTPTLGTRYADFTDSDDWQAIDVSAGTGEGGTFTLDVTPAASTSGAYALWVLYTSDITRTSSHDPLTVTYGQPVTFTGHVNYSGPYDHTGTEVDVYRRGASGGTIWTSMGYAWLDSSGNYSVSAKPTASGNHYALWLGDSDHDVWGTDNRPIVVKAKVTMGTSSSRIRRGSSVRLYGSVAPRHHGTVYIQKKVGDSYRTVGHAALNTLSKWAWRTYPSRSARWRAYFKGDASHAKGYSASRYVRVY